MYLCVPSQESERSCICVLQARRVSGHVFVLWLLILPISTIFSIGFLICEIFLSLFILLQNEAHYMNVLAITVPSFDLL